MNRASAFCVGVLRCLPLAAGVVPFGMVVGVSAANVGMSPWAAVAYSIIVFAGAAQLAALDLLRTGTPLLIVVATAVIINLRLLLYSAALAPHWRRVTVRARLGLAYLLTDQAFALSVARYGEPDGDHHPAATFLGAAAVLWIVWQVATFAGATLGDALPAGLSLEFAVPLAFIALVVPSLCDRPTVAAAIVAVLVALLTAGLPYGLGLLPATAAGIVTGIAIESRADKSLTGVTAEPRTDQSATDLAADPRLDKTP